MWINATASSSEWDPADMGAVRLVDFWAEATNLGTTPGLIDSFTDLVEGRVAYRVLEGYRASLVVSAAMGGKLVAKSPADYATYHIGAPSFITTGTNASIFLVGNALTGSTYQTPWSISGATPMTVTNVATHAGIQPGYQSVGAGTSPSGVFARTWEYDGAVGKIWSPAGQVGVDFVAGDSLYGNTVNDSYLFGSTGNTICYRGSELARWILVDTVDATLRANWFAWCASYYGVTT